MLLVETERAMMKTADEVIVVADSTKFGRTSLARLCELGDVDIMVTDNEIGQEWRTRLTDAGVRLVLASEEVCDESSLTPITTTNDNHNENN